MILQVNDNNQFVVVSNIITRFFKYLYLVIVRRFVLANHSIHCNFLKNNKKKNTCSISISKSSLQSHYLSIGFQYVSSVKRSHAALERSRPTSRHLITWTAQRWILIQQLLDCILVCQWNQRTQAAKAINSRDMATLLDMKMTHIFYCFCLLSILKNHNFLTIF